MQLITMRTDNIGEITIKADNVQAVGWLRDRNGYVVGAYVNVGLRKQAVLGEDAAVQLSRTLQPFMIVGK